MQFSRLALDEDLAVHGAQLFSFVSRLARCFRTGTIPCGRPPFLAARHDSIPPLDGRRMIERKPACSAAVESGLRVGWLQGVRRTLES